MTDSVKSSQAKLNETVNNAVLEERQRISRELHDRALQFLSSARLHAENCQRQLPEESHALKQELVAIENNLDRAMTEIRNLLSENQLDETLQEGDLERRLRDELEIFCKRTGFKLDFQCAINSHNLPGSIEHELYFTLREGVLNAVRHSRASELHLSITQNDRRCEARLRDNGVGFTVAASEGSSHYGLRGMKERIRKVGGELSMQTAPGKGTEIVITVPLQ